MSWTARLDGLAAAWLRFDAEHMPLFHALFHEGGGTTRPDAGLEPCLAALEAVLRGGKQAGEFTVGNVWTAARFLLHGYGGVCFHGEGLVRDPQAPGAPLAAASWTHPEAPEFKRLVREVQTLFRRSAGVREDRT